MIRYFLFALLIVSFLLAQAQAQSVNPPEEENIKLRHISGIRGVDLAIGINKYGHQFSLGYAQYESKKLIGRIVLNSEHGTIHLTKYSSNTIFIGLNHTVLKLQDKLFVNAGYGGLAGWENNSNETLNKKADTFLYGVFIEVNTEVYIFNRLAFLIELKEIYDNGSPFGQFRYYANTGFRIYL